MNRLIQASNGQMTARFWYDAKNRCVARSYNGSVTLNTYDNWNLVAEYDMRGAQVARYVHGRRIDEVVLMVNRHGVFYLHHDVLVNVTMLTDAAGEMVERYSYSVEGAVTVFDAAGREISESAVGNRWMFTGRQWLPEVGLYDYRNRVYSAELGRFLQTDPIRFLAGDINIYRYVGNRLLRSLDPMGLAEMRTYVTTNPSSGIAHASLAGTYDDGREFAIGYHPGDDGKGEIKDDSDRVAGQTPSETFTVSDQELRAGAMELRQYAIDNDYDAIEDNCGAAVDAGNNAAGANSSHNYQNETITNTFVSWGYMIVETFWDWVMNLGE